jgi:Protein of unknown function (DUF1360)
LSTLKANDALVLAVDALATFRLTRLLVEDEITSPIRKAVWKRYDPSDSKLGYLFTCPWCVSIWVGAGIVAARYAAPAQWEPVARVFAGSAVTGMIAERF